MLALISPEEDKRIKELQIALDKIRAIEDQILKELRALVYKIERV